MPLCGNTRLEDRFEVKGEGVMQEIVASQDCRISNMLLLLVEIVAGGNVEGEVHFCPFLQLIFSVRCGVHQVSRLYAMFGTIKGMDIEEFSQIFPSSYPSFYYLPLRGTVPLEGVSRDQLS